jgi:hypothetical protein
LISAIFSTWLLRRKTNRVEHNTDRLTQIIASKSIGPMRSPALVVLSAWGIVLEKFANAMLERIIGGKKKPA